MIIPPGKWRLEIKKKPWEIQNQRSPRKLKKWVAFFIKKNPRAIHKKDRHIIYLFYQLKILYA
jgi:hypothetical protein